MNKCQNCGQANASESQFCRFCGTRILLAQQPAENYDYQSPRPYAWKTDEYQTQTDARQRSKTPLAGNFNPQPLVHSGARDMAGNYRCPNCGTNYLPVVERRISTAGWITFALLLVFTFIFFWIGLLIKEDVSVCPVCKFKLT